LILRFVLSTFLLIIFLLLHNLPSLSLNLLLQYDYSLLFLTNLIILLLKLLRILLSIFIHKIRKARNLLVLTLVFCLNPKRKKLLIISFLALFDKSLIPKWLEHLLFFHLLMNAVGFSTGRYPLFNFAFDLQGVLLVIC